ncbi:MAG TPA: hypothetical protein DEP35_15170 [Deltaproteobacteria bacterium]|nr:hypothetical protein [Deltaproteobacteria bacterium]
MREAPALFVSDSSVTRASTAILGGLLALALVGLATRLITTGSVFGGGSTLRKEFQASCVESCQGVGAPHASCRSACACLIEDLASGKTPDELDRILAVLSRESSARSPELDALEASRQRCVARVTSP